jgi:hypothetical protein
MRDNTVDILAEWFRTEGCCVVDGRVLDLGGGHFLDLGSLANFLEIKEKEGLRFTTPPVSPRPATLMSDILLHAELKRLETWFDHVTEQLRNSGGASGSPGEWLVERMDEIETELKRRAIAKATGEKL